MPKPSEIFDTPEADSRVGDNKKPLRICNKTGVHTCRLGSIHLNEREAQILTEYLTTKDQEREEDGKKSYEDGVKQTIAQFLRMNLENPKAPVNIDEVKRRALTERH